MPNHKTPTNCVNYSKLGLIKRNEDMSPDGKLVLCQEDDGDIIIGIEVSEGSRGMIPSAEFCNMGSGGGRSPNVRKALIALMDAIEQDNRENPIH